MSATFAIKARFIEDARRENSFVSTFPKLRTAESMVSFTEKIAATASRRGNGVITDCAWVYGSGFLDPL